jgi:hypothetical protein
MTKDRTIRILKSLSLPEEALIILAFLLLLAGHFVAPISDFYSSNWLSISAANWVNYFGVLIFDLFLTGYLLIKIFDRKSRLPIAAVALFSVILSLYFSAAFTYLINLCSVPSSAARPIFEVIQLALILSFFATRYLIKPTDATSDHMPLQRKISFNATVALLAVVAVSISLVVIQLFVYQPFPKGDNWSYISQSVIIEKSGFSLSPTGKFYKLTDPFFFNVFLSGLTNMSGFAPVNSLMIVSLLIPCITPIAFYLVCRTYIKERNASIVSTFLYTIASGFGWLTFVGQKVGVTASSFTPDAFVTSINSGLAQVLRDTIQSHGVVTEGLKTYAFALLAVLALLYLIESDLRPKTRILLISVSTAFAFQFHVEELLVFMLAFVPLHMIFSKRKTAELRANLVGLMAGLSVALLINWSFVNNTADALPYSMGLVTLMFTALLSALTLPKIKTVIVTLESKVKPLLSNINSVLFIIAMYLYILAAVILVFYSYTTTSDFASAIASKGISFPWYYYPLSMGITGILVLIGLKLDVAKRRFFLFFLSATVALLILGKVVSFVNMNFFFTGEREFRIVNRVIPVTVSLLGGWVLYETFSFFKENQIRFQYRQKVTGVKHSVKVGTHYVAPALMITVVVLGVPSTVLAAEYWMTSGLTSFGSSVAVDEYDLELSNYIYQNIPITSRIATLDSRGYAVLRVAGATAAMPSFYPDVLLTRPETVALLSSDVRYILINTEGDYQASTDNMLNYFPVAFSNQRYTLYRVPQLKSASESSVGYLPPKSYTSQSLFSYLVVSSLNSSYELLNQDLTDKSVVFLPKDFQETSGRVMSFDGSNGYVDLGQGYDMLSDSLSVDVWFKSSASGKTMSLVNNRISGTSSMGYRIVILSDNQVSAEFNDGNGTISVSAPIELDNSWHNVVAVYDRTSTLRLFVDGMLEREKDISSSLKSVVSDVNLTIGAQENSSLFFDGCISEVRLYTCSLSSNEVALNYGSYLSPQTNGLTLRLSLTDANQTSIRDVVSGKVAGVAHNCSWVLSDLPISNTYTLTSDLLEAVNTGANVVVLGGQGEIFDLFGLAQQYSSEVNGITLGSNGVSFNQTVTIDSLGSNHDLRVLCNYSFDGVTISPFLLQKSYGKGNLFYVYIDPLLDIKANDNFIADDVAAILQQALGTSGLVLDSSETAQSSTSLDQRWMGQYPAYGRAAFTATGEVSVRSTSSAVTIYQPSQNLSTYIEGKSNVEITSDSLVVSPSADGFPNVLTMQLQNATIKITATENSTLTMGGESSESGFILLTLDAGEVTVESPSIALNGEILFEKISIPDNPTAWLENAMAEGTLAFNVAYTDGDSFFSSSFDGDYSVQVPISQVVNPTPWVNVLFSVGNIFLVLIVATIIAVKYLQKFHRQKRLDARKADIESHD